MNSGSAAVTGTAEVNGTRLFYEAAGEGPPLLFVHGFTLDHRMWRRQAQALSDRFRVVCCDLRGFGRSAMPTSESYSHCQDVAALCMHLGLRRVVLVGHSIGAAQTLELALTQPDLVAGWVSVCMSGLGGIPFPKDVTVMFSAIRAAAQAGDLTFAKEIWKTCEWFAPARRSPGLAAELDRMVGDYSAWHWHNENPAKSIAPPASSRLSELRVPALIVTGELDLPYNHAVAEALLRGIPGATTRRLPDVGHMANMEAPESVNRALASFAELVR
jgi:pimeloyl-ACP methyl ester carboxylesterase